jgi:hypothetical protein
MYASTSSAGATEQVLLDASKRKLDLETNPTKPTYIELVGNNSLSRVY